MEILYPQGEEGYERKRVISPEQQKLIEEIVNNSFIEICENYGMPSRDKHQMQQMFLYLEKRAGARAKVEEWVLKALVFALTAYILKEAFGV
jgi:hypothetical protein